MLEYLRNASEKTIAKVLISVLAFSFVGWGVADWIFGGAAGDNTLVSVGNTEISAQEFNVEKSRELSKLDRDAQRAVYADAATQNAFSHQVLTKMVTQQMAQNRADDLGFVVSDKRIAREIREFPEFQVNGEFSTLAFDTVLNNSGYTESAFADVLRDQIARSMVLGATGVSVPVPEFVAQAAYNARYGQREIQYVTVNYADFDVVNPTDEQLAEYYKQNPQIVPEMRTVSYVIVPTEMAQPDKYDVGYATAVKVEDDIIAGETMADAAQKHGAKYVALGKFDREHRPVDAILTDSMVEKVFDMEVGLESEMIETKDGFVFIRVDEVVPSHAAEFDSVKSSLVADWKRAEQKKQAYVRANDILVGLNGGADMAGAKIATVSRASGAPTAVLVDAFRTNVGTNAIVQGDDAFYVLGVKKAIAPAQDAQKMTNVKTEMQNIYKSAVMDDYNSFLGREYPTVVNEKVYNRVFAD